MKSTTHGINNDLAVHRCWFFGGGIGVIGPSGQQESVDNSQHCFHGVEWWPIEYDGGRGLVRRCGSESVARNRCLDRDRHVPAEGNRPYGDGSIKNSNQD